MEIAPDFESNGPIRYTHRKGEDLDLYFVANRSEETVEAACMFRVTGKRPELWDPLDGTKRHLPQFTMQTGRTAVPMRFEPHQSYFVLFREEPSAGNEPTDTAKNFPQPEHVGKLDGSWQVSFEPKLGGPGEVTLDALEDWSQRSEPGVKHYSGIATYRKTFDMPGEAITGSGRFFLDLGVVHNLARVRLNGHDLGIVWCAPWRCGHDGSHSGGRQQSRD